MEHNYYNSIPGKEPPLGGLVDSRLTLTQPCALGALGALGQVSLCGPCGRGWGAAGLSPGAESLGFPVAFLLLLFSLILVEGLVPSFPLSLPPSPNRTERLALLQAWALSKSLYQQFHQGHEMGIPGQ